MGGDAIILNVPRVGAESVNSNNNNKVDLNIKENIWAAMTGQGDQRAYRAQTIIFKE
jgi:hypothetical protein